MSSDWPPSACTAMWGSCGSLVATSREVARLSPRGLGWPAPTLHYHPLGQELRLFRRSGALVVRGHQPYRPRHIRVRFLVLSVREYVAEDTGGWYAAPCVGRDRLP